MKKELEVKGLQMRKIDKLATIITDGTKVAIYTREGRTYAPKLSTAIARMEAQGYNIDMEGWV